MSPWPRVIWCRVIISNVVIFSARRVMNTCPWRENRPGLIIPDPRPAPEESLASVIIGKWCNTRPGPTSVSGHTGHCVTSRTIRPDWPFQIHSSNSMSLERKKRRRKRRSVSETSLNESGSSGSSGQSNSGEKTSDTNIYCQLKYVMSGSRGGRGSRRSSTTNLVTSLREPDNDLPVVSQLE